MSQPTEISIKVSWTHKNCELFLLQDSRRAMEAEMSPDCTADGLFLRRVIVGGDGQFRSPMIKGIFLAVGMSYLIAFAEIAHYLRRAFEETLADSTKCSKGDSAAGRCYGGFARISTVVNQARNSSMPTLFLDAGDTYDGSIWFTVYKWEIVSKFLNILAPNASSLGNHEFDQGLEGLKPYLARASYPIVASNVDLKNNALLPRSSLSNSTIVEFNGTRIGIIGYVTPNTMYEGNPGNVDFFDEIKSIQREVDKLRANGIEIFIALGHSGIDMDLQIAREVDGLDMIVGGHSHTFLYTGEPPDSEKTNYTYPIKVEREDGSIVYVVQAYAYTKYLGNITVGFDRTGNVTNIAGRPILLNKEIEQDPDVLAELEKWRAPVTTLENTIVGKTKVFLDGQWNSCRKQECNLGNLITDAMIDYNLKHFNGSDAWTDAAIAIHESGSIRASIPRTNDGKITMSDIWTVLPYNDEMMKVTVTGKEILHALEWSVYSLEQNQTANFKGAYLQVSGLRVKYDLMQSPGSKVLYTEVRCTICDIPSFSEINIEANYTILLTGYLARGGDGFNVFKKSLVSHTEPR
ncbi:protein 5NUC-like [Venturia canescens]|uniref:protein 5NUC-like n=1 Tax=Venturia canescens TaxID=32260 RepID=UPI001C9C67E6|nr:protein 5NUC-like [Venturia canescens]